MCWRVLPFLQVPTDELSAARAAYLVKHPQAGMWIDFSDFAMYRMEIVDVYYVGGFGNEHYIGWIAPSEYLSHNVTVTTKLQSVIELKPHVD
jgi:hypothetical protein